MAFFVYSGKALRNSMSERMGGFGFSKSRAKYYDTVTITNRYSDIAGLDSAKQDLQEIIWYLKNPEHYRQLGEKCLQVY